MAIPLPLQSQESRRMNQQQAPATTVRMPMAWALLRFRSEQNETAMEEDACTLSSSPRRTVKAVVLKALSPWSYLTIRELHRHLEAVRSIPPVVQTETNESAGCVPALSLLCFVCVVPSKACRRKSAKGG